MYVCVYIYSLVCIYMYVYTDNRYIIAQALQTDASKQIPVYCSVKCDSLGKLLGL